MVTNIIQDEHGSFYLIEFTPLYGRVSDPEGRLELFGVFHAIDKSNREMTCHFPLNAQIVQVFARLAPFFMVKTCQICPLDTFCSSLPATFIRAPLPAHEKGTA